MHCDVTDLASVQESVRLTLEQFGRIDIAIANAGVLGRGGTLRTASSSYLRILVAQSM